jgi:hypothetical protein
VAGLAPPLDTTFGRRGTSPIETRRSFANSGDRAARSASVANYLTRSGDTEQHSRLAEPGVRPARAYALPR